MSLPRYHHSSLPATRKQKIVAFFAILCGLLILENVPEATASFHGQDFYTIAGVRSTTEVFRAGGTYRLHDYSMLAPACDDCEPLEIQASFGVQDQPTVVNIYGRASVPTHVCSVSAQLAPNPVGIPDPVVISEASSPDFPPPRALPSC